MPPIQQPDLSQIIAALSDPAAYPHPVDTVCVMQTHISCVFLTGNFAYKIKKPVDFGFLNYKTPQSRHAFCEQEVLLNRRLCPDIYLGTIPITLDKGRLQVDGGGDCVDWAVQMRQLRAEDMLPARLAARSAGEAEVRRIAGILADFHSRAADTPEIRVWGEPAVIARTIRNTLDVMEAHSGETHSAEARAAIRDSLLQFVNQERDLLHRRMETGRVRDCHGDLRIQNICLDSRFDGGIQIFDCIEFNEEFRYIDVAADVAYLAMDLDLAGRADLREALLDVYCPARNDDTLVQVLRFYQIYRACVRGNIALLAAEEKEIPTTEREVQRNIAATAYDLARCYARKRTGPALLITVGLSGSGKSVLARELSCRLPAVLFSSDLVRKEQAGVAETVALDETQYVASRRASVYAELYRKAAKHLLRGEQVILDATFLATQERRAAQQLAAAHGAEFWVLECRCPDAVIRHRLNARSGQKTVSDADLEVYEEQLRSYAPILSQSGDGHNSHHLVVNTDQSARMAARMVVEHFTDHADVTNRRSTIR